MALHVTLGTESNALISGHPGGVTPGTYAGMGRDLLILVTNFKPGMGGMD